MPTHHVILGSGIAGLSAAEVIREREPKAVISMVSEEPHDFYSRPGLAYFLRADFPEKQLYVRSPAAIAALRVQRITGRVEQLLCGPHELVLADGKRVRYDRLLLATGALAVPATFPGKDLGGVVKLDGLDDTRHILQLARRGQPAVVVGGGITALELAEGLNARGMRVQYFLRGDRYWGDVLDETESTIVMDRLRHEGITIRTKTQVKQALGVNGKLTGVETQAGENVPCQVLAVAIGVRPRMDLAVSAGLMTKKGVLVNEFLQTSMPDIYAAGDVAEVCDSKSATTTLDVLWPIALAHGRIAGANMTGASKPYIKGISFNVTMLAGLKVAIIGAIGGGKNEDLVAITRGESESWRLMPKAWVISDRDDVNRVRLVLGERTILGALVMGEQKWARPLQRLIVAQADITAIRPALVAGGAASLKQLAEFFETWQQAQKR